MKISKPTLRRRHVGALAAIAILAGCSGYQPPSGASSLEPAGRHRLHKATTSHYVYVSDRTQQQLLVYPAGQSNPSPIRTVTQGLSQVGGVAVDPSGDVYIANSPTSNGAGTPKVLEFSSGATSLVRTFSIGLHHPVTVAVGPNGVVYVSDQDGASSAIVEYAATGGAPIGTLTTPHGSDAPPRGVAVDSSGDVFVAISGNGDFWPPSLLCQAINAVYEYKGGSGAPIQIGYSEQDWGLAVDSNANLYEADICLEHVWELSPPNYQYPAGSTYGPFHVPVYIGLSSDNLLTVPSANGGGSGINGLVSVIDLTGVRAPITISTGLKGPIGAIAGP